MFGVKMCAQVWDMAANVLHCVYGIFVRREYAWFVKDQISKMAYFTAEWITMLKLRTIKLFNVPLFGISS